MGQCVLVNGTLHMWARIDEKHNYEENNLYFSNMKKIIKHYQWLADLLSHGDTIPNLHMTHPKLNCESWITEHTCTEKIEKELI